MSLMQQSQMEMSETNDRRRQIPHHALTRAVSPNFNSLPEQLPYPYQKRIVNFNNYSGVKNNIENSYFKSRAKSAPLKKAGQDTQHNQQTNEELHHSSPGKQRVLSAPSSQPSIESDYFNSALSTDGQELYIDPQYDSLSQTELDEHLSPKHKQSRNSAESLASEPQFSDTMFWLMEMTNKSLIKERGPPPNNSHNSHGNTDALRFDEFGGVINSDGPVTQKLNNFMSPAPVAGVNTREANFVPNTQNYHVQPPLQDNNAQLTQPQRVPSPIQQRVQSPSQTDPQVHYSAKTVRKLQHQNLKGVTHMKFEGESTASPYLFHLVTSNPRLGNAAVAIAKLNLKPGERPPMGEKHGDKRTAGEANRLVGEKPVEKPLPKSVPPTTLGNHTSQSYAVIQSSAHKEGERTTHDVFNSTLANHIPDSAVEQFKQSRLTQSADGPHRRRGKPGLTTQTSEFSTTLAAGTQLHPQETSSPFQRSMFLSDGRPKTALDRVNAFKRQIPNSNVDLAVRAMKGQQGAWTTQTQHGGRVRQNNLMVSSADNAATGSIDQLISSLRFPNNTLPPSNIKTQQHGHNNTNSNANSSRFDNTFQSLTSGTEEPDMFATTIDFGSSVQTLHYNHTTGNTMNNTLNNTASNTHISPHKNNSNDNKDLLHSIHKDPLYNVLREECEQLKNTLYRNPEAKHTLNNTKRLLTHTATSEQLPPLAQIRNNQMLKQVENELISDSITTQEIKIMRSFMSLPPAVWVTARIVYALVSSYFECYLGLENEKSFLHSGSSAIYNKQSRGNLMSFWETVEKQQKVDKLTLSSMESLYSWPYLQALLVNPLQFVKALQLIERGVVSAEHNEYFEHFPIEKLHFLRELIQNGQGLFHESVVITTGVPVCAKLCSWAKRVIANIYSSCLERMRAIQEASAGRSVSPELLQQTQRQQIQPELTITTKSPQKPHSAGGNIAGGNRLLKSTRYPHNMTIVSLLQQTEPPPLLPLTNYDAYHYANVPHSQNNAGHYDMSVFEYTMTVAKPIDTLQMWLLPYAPNSGDANGDAQQETYSSELLEMREFFNDKLRITSASPLHTVTLLSDLPSEDSLLQANSSVQTLTAHNYLSQHAASAADLNAPTVSYKEVVAFSNKHSAGDGRISPTSRPSSKPNSANKSAISRPTSSHFNNSLSHSLAHSVMFTNYGGVVLHPALQQLLNPSGTQPDLLVVSGSTKLITAEIGSDPESIRSFLESKKLHFNFSLLLAHDKKNNIINSSQVVNSQQISQSQLLEGRGPDTVHQYVVCVTDTVNSWNAFQLALRMAKSSDVITVVHIPVVNTEEQISTTISSAGQSNSVVVQSNRDTGLAYTLTKYKQQIKRAVKRIETLTALYRSAGYNLFVDEIPDFFDEAHRHISYVFQRSAAETRYKQIQREIAAENRVESGAYYATNQAKNYLATRLLSVVETYKPDFILLGSDSTDLAVALSVGGTQPLSSSFPFSEDVAESAVGAGAGISHKDVAHIDSKPHPSVAVPQPQRPTDKVQRAHPSTQQQSSVNVGVVPTSKNITVYSSHPLDADKSVYLTDQTVLDDGDSVNFIYNDNATSLFSQTHNSGSFASLPAATTYRSSAESTTAATIAPAVATSTVTSSSNHGVGKASPTPSADEDAYGDEYDNDSFIIADDDGTNVNSVTSGEYVVLKKRSGGGRSGDSNNSIGGNSANNQEYANDEFETDILDNDDAYDVLSPHHQGNYNRPTSSRGGNSSNNNINNANDANNLSYSMSMEPDDFLHSPLKFNINAVGSNTKSVSGNFPAATADKATGVVNIGTLANAETDKQYVADYCAYCSHKVPLVEMFLFSLRAKQQRAAAAATSADVLSGVESGLQGGLKSGLSHSAVVLVNQRASL